ncbi:SDR family NAD(P)-dependent oxidoreductase [Nannocystis pusilla]|uniref:SDR family NAD(P)-dependent oxidoreductase n=1 Tax=Nannocystis pusilla TaxID=889268 RepID=UPI003B7802DD
MTARQPLALVTGANRGLGLEVCRQLRDRGYRVILTARQAEHGRAAAQELGVEFVPLDVRDPASVDRLVAELKRVHPEGLDVVIANAGVALDGFDGQVAETTIDTNYFGVLRVVEGVLRCCGPRRTSSWSRAASASATCCRPSWARASTSRRSRAPSCRR